MAGGEQAGQQGGFLGPSPTGGGSGGGAVTSVDTIDPLLTVAPTTGDVLVSQKIGATWGTVGSIRYFACDGTNGNDANAGFSDVSQAAAGLVAVKTIAKLLTLIPKLGYGRRFRAAIRAGNYASDSVIDLSGFIGYQNSLFIGTDTIASAGAVAFAGDTNDTIGSGMTTATGMNAAGYNPTAYAVAADGTPTITLQLNGGGAPGFGATPARPYGCRLRFDVNTTTAALRNKCFSIILAPTSSTAILGLPLGTNPVVGDVCYIEMPNVTGPTSTLCQFSGGNNSPLQLCGLNAGQIHADGSFLTICGSESSLLIGGPLNLNLLNTVINLPIAAIGVGTSLRADQINLAGGTYSIADMTHTGIGGPFIIREPGVITWERSSASGLIAYGGAHATGNNVVEELGTNISTNHGAACQIWAPIPTTIGVKKCGLANYGGYFLARIKFSNMGANPCVVANAAGAGIFVELISGGVADGNLDVGFDLSGTIPAMGCNVAILPTPTATGTNGDVRLSDGTVVSWTTAQAGVIDPNGNHLYAAGAAPLGTKVASAATAVALGNVAPGTVTSSTPTAWTPLVINGVKYLVPLWPST